MGNERMGHMQRWHTDADGSVPRQQWQYQDDRCRIRLPARETIGDTAVHSYESANDCCHATADQSNKTSGDIHHAIAA